MQTLIDDNGLLKGLTAKFADPLDHQSAISTRLILRFHATKSLSSRCPLGVS